MHSADATGSMAPRWRRWAVDTYLAIRVSTLGFTWLLPLVGAASVAPGWRPAQTAWLLAIALAFHIFAYMLNDVVDLDVDRSELLRADSPLVRGTIGRGQALVLAGLQVPVAFALALAAGLALAALGWLALAFVALGLYDVFGKRCAWPPLTDAVQAAGWCALLLLGAAAADAAIAPATAWLVAYVAIAVLLVNGVHGALRDLANDQRRGARTTALWLGARPGAGSAVRIPRRLTAYALTLQAGLVVTALAAWQALDHGSPVGRHLSLALTAAALLAASGSLVVAMQRAADRRALIAAGAWNIVATLLVLPALVLARLGAAGGMLLLAVFLLPTVAMWAYNGSHWGLARGTRHARAGLGLMRVDKPICATFYAFLGAYLAGPVEALWSAPVLLAAAAVGFITAFGFVINDCCDLAVDRIGKPDRPLPAGQVSLRTAQVYAWVLAAIGVALGASLGGVAALWAVGAVALSGAYSMRLKRTLLLGNATVALLVAAVLVFGAIAAGGATPQVWLAAAVAFSYVLAQEALFTLEDETDDRRAGLRTTATILGRARAAKLVRGLLAAFGAIALAPWLVGHASVLYAVTLVLLTLAPVALMAWWLRAPAPAAQVARAARLSRLPWLTSFVPLVLLG